MLDASLTTGVALCPEALEGFEVEIARVAIAGRRVRAGVAASNVSWSRWERGTRGAIHTPQAKGARCGKHH
jgi:hypothetical protein